MQCHISLSARNEDWALVAGTSRWRNEGVRSGSWNLRINFNDYVNFDACYVKNNTVLRQAVNRTFLASTPPKLQLLRWTWIILHNIAWCAEAGMWRLHDYIILSNFYTQNITISWEPTPSFRRLGPTRGQSTRLRFAMSRFRTQVLLRFPE